MDLLALSAVELRRRIGTREISPVELLEACIERIVALNPATNAITGADVAEAIFEARGVRVDRRHISVEPAIRAVGTYSVPVELAPGLTTEVKTIVSPLLD